ncbi:glycosyltransferase family 2 protein [Paraburkholderia aromaticivorans]|uniref:Glycosyl transferase n=1 Tax=Paraburkholderia aromaticivorans TaxID=2026199 RepID=A0A248VDF7_9BURK|nr:glycosyltransferase family 2 protein [Paraburkholderia aromaticivorans]ASV97018.1 glycosyl transferase [Paraburkholderia aromaticivorans]
MNQHDTQLQGAASLRIQSILYGNTQQHVDQSLASLGRAVELAISSGALSKVQMAFGDCSPDPVFTDEEIEERRKRFEAQGLGDIQYEFYDKNLGSAAGHNRLLEGLNSELVLILNPDTVVAPDLFIELVKPMRERQRVAVVEARQVPIEHPKDYSVASGETGWVTTACALVTAAVAKEVNGFDSESFFLYCDDVDFSWRIRLAGYKLVFQPSAVIFHDKRLSQEGKWIVGAAEEYFSAEAAMMLSYKYSRADLADRIERQLLDAGSESEKKAARKFQSLKESGKLPVQIDADHKVAQFIDGFYSKHRF